MAAHRMRPVAAVGGGSRPGVSAFLPYCRPDNRKQSEPTCTKATRRKKLTPLKPRVPDVAATRACSWCPHAHTASLLGTTPAYRQPGPTTARPRAPTFCHMSGVAAPVRSGPRAHHLPPSEALAYMHSLRRTAFASTAFAAHVPTKTTLPSIPGSRPPLLLSAYQPCLHQHTSKSMPRHDAFRRSQ